MSKISTVCAAIVIGLGITAGGYFIGNGIQQLKTNNRYVNVRGLSEKDVLADTAQLSISITDKGDVPGELFPKIAAAQDKVIAALKAQGLKDDEIQTGQWSTDRTRPEDRKNDPSLPLYTAWGSVSVKTHNVTAIAKVMGQLNALQMATQGAIADSNVSYSFNGIGKLRAEMIAAATKDARNAALQFAADSGSQVGSIRNASQGVFQILANGSDSDDGSVMNKTVRVVTTVTYELRDQ